MARDPDTLLLIVTCLIRIAALVRQSEVPKRHVFHAVVKSIDKILFCRMKQSANTAFTLNFSNCAVQNGIMIRHHHFMNICINFTTCCIFFCRNKEYHYAERMYPSKIKRPWLSIVKHLIKSKYNIKSKDFQFTENGKYIRTHTYSFTKI